MPAYFNIADFLKIGIMAAVFVFLANKLLAKLGIEDLQA